MACVTWPPVGLPTFRTKTDDDNDDPANKPPVVANDSAATTAGKAITLNVLANDSDPDGNVPLTVTGLSQPDSGQEPSAQTAPP